MTGFGHSSRETDDFIVSTEIKSLNSRYFDANIRLPRAFSEKEIELRGLLNKELQRGKVAITLNLDYTNPEKIKNKLNKQIFTSYFDDINALADEMSLSKSNLLEIIIGLPEVLQSKLDESIENDWKIVVEVIKEALRNLDEFRLEEGQVLKVEFQKYLKNIISEASDIKTEKDNRIHEIRKRLQEKVQELLSGNSTDENRFEQEILYYIEKLDITEELVRLESHCQYFMEVMNEPFCGKKLNFISQEIGREINTIGAKANDFSIQKKVVLMKEELEKIKEQVQNIL